MRGEDRRRARVERRLFQPDEREALLDRERARELRLVEQTPVDEEATERLPHGLALGERLVDRPLGDEPEPEEDRPERKPAQLAHGVDQRHRAGRGSVVWDRIRSHGTISRRAVLSLRASAGSG